MKVIIAGPRNYWPKIQFVNEVVIRSGFDITEVVSGGASGVDAVGELWAKENNVPVKRFPANWNLHGKAAGPIRNKDMAKYADALIAFVPYRSKGTANMLKVANEHNLKILICK